MARIRSVHPGLRKDEDFMPLSFVARVALIGIWQECDDWGAFQWKPLTLKAEIFPADNLDMSEILAELESHNWVKRIEVAGKAFGICRSFCKWQHPKDPKFVHFIPPEFRGYVAYRPDERHKLPEAPIYKVERPPRDLPETSPNSLLMEDGEGSRNPPLNGPQPSAEERPTLTLVPTSPRPKQQEPPGFAEFYAAFPRKVKRPKAAQAYAKALKNGANPHEILAGAMRYAAQRRGEDPQFTMHPTTWLNGECWKDRPEDNQSNQGVKCPL